MNKTSKSFVVVSRDETVIGALRAAVGSDAALHVVEDLAALRALAGEVHASGIVVDDQALRVQPVQQLARLRADSPLVNILFVVSELRGALLNDIQPLRVELLARPLPSSAIERFVRRTLTTGRLSDTQMGAWIERLASEHKLSGNDLALFPLVLERETPEALCARLNIDQAALSRGLRRLVKKCRVRNTDRLAKNVMRDALLSSALSTSAFGASFASA